MVSLGKKQKKENDKTGANGQELEWEGKFCHVVFHINKHLCTGGSIRSIDPLNDSAYLILRQTGGACLKKLKPLFRP